MSQVKIAVTSDLHLPITSAEAVRDQVDEIARFGVDVVVLAGDLAETLVMFDQCLQFFRDKLTCPILVLPGNHDLWVRREPDSRQLWTTILPERTARVGCT